jgi:hypothetical protein
MRRIRGKTLMLALAAAAVGTAACGGGAARRSMRDPSSTTSTTSAALTTRAGLTNATTASAPDDTMRTSATSKPAQVGVPSAVMRVTMARCDRQATCNHVGINRTFGDRDACANEIGHDVVAALSPEECPSGIDAERLAACVSELQAEPCSDKATSADGPSSCGRERLCAPSL